MSKSKINNEALMNHFKWQDRILEVNDGFTSELQDGTTINIYEIGENEWRYKIICSWSKDGAVGKIISGLAETCGLAKETAAEEYSNYIWNNTRQMSADRALRAIDNIATVYYSPKGNGYEYEFSIDEIPNALDEWRHHHWIRGNLDEADFAYIKRKFVQVYFAHFEAKQKAKKNLGKF